MHTGINQNQLVNLICRRVCGACHMIYADGFLNWRALNEEKQNKKQDMLRRSAGGRGEKRHALNSRQVLTVNTQQTINQLVGTSACSNFPQKILNFHTLKLVGSAPNPNQYQPKANRTEPQPVPL